VAQGFGQPADDVWNGQAVIGIAGHRGTAGHRGIKRHPAGGKAAGVAADGAGGRVGLDVICGRRGQAQGAVGDLGDHAVDQNVAAVIAPGQAARRGAAAAIEHGRTGGVEGSVGGDFLAGL
ncbi:hypothetical protein EG878_17435, partial [Enterococcus faecalis]